MTSPAPQQSMAAVAATIHTRTDHAVLGAQMGTAGLSEAEVSNLFGLIERQVRDGSSDLARTTTLSIMPIVLKLIQDTHKATAMAIYHRLKARNDKTMGIISHNACCQVALDVYNTIPSHIPPVD